jgi:hypothetical protein
VDNFSQTVIFRSISYMYIINIAGRISEASMGGVADAQRVFRINEPKITGARSARALTRGKNPQV